MSARKIKAADLFCGAGGTSAGMLRAAEDTGVDMSLLAINHWPTAIASHSLNHPDVLHKCESLENISPRDEVPGGRLHLLAASPECIHHSNAAGGRPKNEQSRATAWQICRWASDVTVDAIMIENVVEFEKWGPLTAQGKPIKARKGETYRAFIRTLEGMGYRVEARKQCAADYGDPTSRVRLMIMAVRDGKELRWPEPTHGPGRGQPYRTAREIIDWDLKGRSIFDRKKPLAANTIRRIASGLKKFGGANAKPFLIKLYGTGMTADIDEPLPTVTGAHRGEMALIEPFITPYYGTADAKNVDEPLDTVTAKARFALVEPGEIDGRIDIRLRMLQPHELQLAMSFPLSYQFTGTKEDKTKQIGNAVPVEMARAHARALLAYA